MLTYSFISRQWGAEPGTSITWRISALLHHMLFEITSSLLRNANWAFTVSYEIISFVLGNESQLYSDNFIYLSSIRITSCLDFSGDPNEKFWCWEMTMKISSHLLHQKWWKIIIDKFVSVYTEFSKHWYEQKSACISRSDNFPILSVKPTELRKLENFETWVYRQRSSYGTVTIYVE